MSLKALRDEIVEEITTILASDFKIDVASTNSVPHASDSSITFPNLDAKRQGAKLIKTCVLYIDIRRSTELNFTHRRETVAKLYSAFVRAMSRCARHHKGHVRGIIGDRVMVLFDSDDCFVNAIECAVSMHSIAHYIINKNFQRNEVKCGIGIDFGNMLATKTGIRKKGSDQHAYRNLVWLGNPANVASKLTDLANKAAETTTLALIDVAYQSNPFGISLSSGWNWRREFPHIFVRKLTVDPISRRITHPDPQLASILPRDEPHTVKPKTGSILITEAVWTGYKALRPASNIVTQSMFSEIALQVPGHREKIYSGDIYYPALAE